MRLARLHRRFYFGDPGDRFVSGDCGVVDGVDTPAVFRPCAAHR